MLSFSQLKHKLNEGGAYGHLSNVWDENFTKKELVDIINNSLDLKFEYGEIKTDATNLTISYKNGKVIAARNKGHIKNFGKDALDAKSIRDKFSGRELGDAYGMALDDLQTALNALSDKQKEKIFDNGKHWMSVEIIGHGSSNIIDYGSTEIRLHGTTEYGEDGEKISGINKETARMLDGMLRQKKVERQKGFSIMKLTPTQFNPIKNVEKRKASLITNLNSIMSGYNDIDSFKKGKLRAIISKNTKDSSLIDQLIDRWVDGNKSKTITALYKEYPNDKSWIQTMDKEIGSILKDIIIPLEYIFLKLGSLVLGSLKVFMVKDPDKVKKDIRKMVDDAIKTIESSGSEKDRSKLELELKRIEAAGGVNRISPEEGITFFVGDKFIKLTAQFGPVNQILGMVRFK